MIFFGKSDEYDSVALTTQNSIKNLVLRQTPSTYYLIHLR